MLFDNCLIKWTLLSIQSWSNAFSRAENVEAEEEVQLGHLQKVYFNCNCLLSTKGLFA